LINNDENNDLISYLKILKKKIVTPSKLTLLE